jgi:hypothetical protein
MNALKYNTGQSPLGNKNHIPLGDQVKILEHHIGTLKKLINSDDCRNFQKATLLGVLQDCIKQKRLIQESIDKMMKTFSIN